jgi:hypothetical protein
MATLSIQGSVGKGGKNAYNDVRTVQKLLNQRRGSSPRISEDGVCGPATINAIIRFQRNVMKWSTADGRVDPGGSTWRALNGLRPSPGGGGRFVHLPLKGRGYYVFTSSSKVWGTRATIRSVKKLGAKVKKELGLEIGINDISYANGALMPPHASHRNGVDVDIRLLRKDGAKLPVTIYDAQYSHSRNKRVVELLWTDSNLSFILFNDTKIPGVQYYVNHHHHMHAHFKG